MANPPPPYANITGISRTVMKDNAQETIVNYDGNARPGEIVVDLTTDPPTPYIGNNAGDLTLLTSAGTYGNVQVGQYLAAGAVGNIIPSGNGIYSLGNSTNYWSNVWIAGNTLYLGGVPLGMSGNVLTVDGNSVLINNTDENISTLGNVTAGNIDITGGDLNWANASIVQTSNIDFSITGDGQVTVRSLDGTYQWTFDDAGNLTAPGNIGTLANVSAGYFIGNGAFLTGISGGGGSGNALVNDDNTFTLQSDGNVVFSGPTGGVNRGVVWDFGAVANGVNSEVRQDVAGITVRAWTENGGGGTYAAPVNIVTNQDANVNTWVFDGEGDLTLPGNMILSAGNIRSNAIAPAFNSAITGINSGNANVIITIAGEPFDGPASGAVTISGVNPPVQANGDWWYQATGFNEFQLFSDPSLTTPVDGTEWPGYVDGGTAVGVGEYSNLTIQGGNISITSNDNTWIFDTTGNLRIPNDIVSNTTIDIDNRLSGNTADIRLYSADDILLQARDRSEGSGTEGGDINIYAGDSATDGDASGGDIQIIAGNGGAANVDFGGSGGFITIRSGDGGPAIGNSGYNAEDGGDITIQAGSAGDNGGNSSAGSNGGDVFIFSGAATGNNISGGNIVISTGSGGPNGAGGAVQIGIPFSDRGPGAVWTFDGTGNLIVPSTGYINGEDAAWVRIQSLDEGVVRSSMTLNPDGVARLQSWDNQNSQSFTSADWATGEYVDNGGSGEIVFIDAPNIRSFFDTIFTGRFFYQVNGGNLLPSIGWGGGGNNITFYTSVLPATSPETVTNFTVYYSNQSVIEMDYDEGEMNLIAREIDITINGDRAVDVQSSDRLRIENSSNVNGITISTDTANTFRTWTFGVDGNLTLPLGGTINEGPSPSFLGNAVTITPAGGNDPNQQLKIYPTFAEGNHLHLTSGNLAVTDVFLGDDSQYIRTTTTGGMTIGTGGGEISGGYVWSFEENGNLIFPDGASIGSGAFNGTASSTVSLNAFSPDGNTVSIRAQGNTSSAVISIFSNAGPVTSNWTFTTSDLDPSESFLFVPPGGTITTTTATGGEGGKNIFIQAGASDSEFWNSNPGGELFIKGGYGSFGDGGGGAGGNVYIEGGSSSDSHAGNVNIASGLNTWVFDYTGNLALPGQIISSNSASRLSLDEQGGGGAYLTSTNNDTTALFLRTNDVQMYAGINQTILAGTILPGLETDYADSRQVLEDLFTQNQGLPGYPWGITLPVSYATYNELILLAPGTFPNQAACTVQANNTNNSYELWQDTIADTNVTITANELSWIFDGTGNLTIPGTSGGLIKTVANAAIGIVAMDNGSDNPAQLMSWNVNQPNPNTIISVHANYAAVTTDVNGTVKSWIFDNSGNLTTPGNIVVATGIVGSGASPAPYLSGFSSVSAMNISASGNVSSRIAITTPVAFANLTPVAGGRAFVNNANLAAAGNFGANVSGGGSNTVPVWSDGTNWYIG